MADSPSNVEDSLAIVSGRGELPKLLAEECILTSRKYCVVTFDHLPLDWTKSHPAINVAFEAVGGLIDQLKAGNFKKVVFAGAMERKEIDQSKLDPKGMELASILLDTFKSGDDTTLVSIIDFFTDNDFEVVGAQHVCRSLIPSPGILTDCVPSNDDEDDADRAADIVEGIGRLDVGQGAVVGQGLCLAVESIQGTDCMLTFVADNRDGYLTDPNGSKGLLFKAPKPDQDMRVDVPVIGPETVRGVYDAGLAGIVIEEGGVMILNREATVSLANELGMFIWVRPVK